MATSETPSTVCAVCGEAVTTFCSGCAGDRNISDYVPTPTWYCGKDCQRSDWQSHKRSCQIVQAKVKLFRAGALLQQAFQATRAEAFDLGIAKIEYDQDGYIHFFDNPAHWGLRPVSSTLTNSLNGKYAVLSYGAGGDVLTGVMFEPCKKALQGYVAKVEEVDVRVFQSRVKMYRHFARDPQTSTVDATHAVLRVTLKDNSVWALDLAGVQHGQHKPVVEFKEYDRDYVAEILDTRPFGASARSEQSIVKRHHSDGVISMQWRGIQTGQMDELAEWEHHNVAVEELIKAKTDDHQKLKQELTDHLATAAREYVKHSWQDPTSTAKPITVGALASKNMSTEDKGRMERKRARMLAGMEPEFREAWLKQEAVGAAIIM